jgi:prevent-host-death family protein
MQTVSISAVKRVISDLVNRVTYGGERIILTSRGHPKAALVSIADLERLQAHETTQAEQARLAQWANLRQAREARDQITTRTGSALPDSADEIHELREERDDEVAGLR